jgi:hypothetical protein
MESTLHESTVNDLTFEGPATYRIRIKGLLDDHWADRLGGMTISTNRVGDRETVTTLCGQVLDQAALFGVLNTLYDLHIPILSVECLGKNQAVEPESCR